LGKVRSIAVVAPATPAIELIDVHVALGGSWVLRGLSLAAPRGRITVLLGPSGVGKTTCLRHITGLLIPDKGDVLIGGRSTLSMPRGKRLELSRRFGVLLEGSGLYGSALWESMTVEQNLIHQLRAQRNGSERELRGLALEWLGVVGLSASAELMPETLSAGMRRRLAVARALVADPEYVVLDSFELGADPVRLAELIRIIGESHERTGATYVIATQSLDVARELADELVVMWEGQVIEEGPVAGVLGSEQPEVHQLINGLADGPLGMAGAAGAGRGPSARPPSDHIEGAFELPVSVVAVAVLAIMTASALWLGHGGTPEIVAVLVVWAITVAVIAMRGR
jgi:phospholipid/cholesterol/gamma-HCH transport system ATP-binding protein